MQEGWWDRVPQELKDYYRAKNVSEDAAKMEAYKRKHSHLRFGTDVTGWTNPESGLSVKSDPPPSGFVDEPEVYDDNAYSRPVVPEVILAVQGDEVVTTVVMLEKEEEDID